jgi:hypothetical protein
MSNHEAKFILGACRPGGRDADQPTFRAALAQAGSDPELGAWWARAQAHDAAMAAKLREIAPPAGLREAILAGARASRAPRAARRFPTVWLALAASVALVLAASLALWPRRAGADPARLTAFALDDTAHGQHGGHGTAAGALQARLSQPTTRLGGGLSVEFATLRATGCRTLTLAGHDVLEVCFQRDGVWFHCYIAKCADFPAPGAGAPAAFVQQAQLACATWADATHRFVLVTDAGLEAVKRLL